MTSQFGPLGEPGDVVTAAMVRGRILQIADLAKPGELPAVIVAELRYLADQLAMTIQR